MNDIRINKYLSSRGVCSRREADRLIDGGRITVNGEVASLGIMVSVNDDVRLDGHRIVGGDEPVVLAFNKPEGIVCTSARDEKNNIIDYINYPTRIYPIGRLDKESSGLILLTNRGEIVNGILKAKNYHEKEYIVTLNKPYSTDFLKNMRRGVYLNELDVTTRPAQVRTIDDKTFSIILTQGLNRQIRRMCSELKYRVVKLKRIRIMNIMLGDLPKGKYRTVQGEELEQLISDIEV